MSIGHSEIPPLDKIAPNLKHLKLVNPETGKDRPDRYAIMNIIIITKYIWDTHFSINRCADHARNFWRVKKYWKLSYIHHTCWYFGFTHSLSFCVCGKSFCPRKSRWLYIMMYSYLYHIQTQYHYHEAHHWCTLKCIYFHKYNEFPSTVSKSTTFGWIVFKIDHFV